MRIRVDEGTMIGLGVTFFATTVGLILVFKGLEKLFERRPCKF